jgi:hypothetical protein
MYFALLGINKNMKAKEILVEFYDPASDELGIAHMDDTRRPRLTMLHLQKLRKSRDIEKYETAQHINFLPDMYGVSAEQGGGDMGGLGGL